MSPAHSAKINDPKPVFSWIEPTDPGGSGISHYEIRIDNDLLFRSPEFGYFFYNDFATGDISAWHPDNGAYWSLQNGEYVANTPGDTETFAGQNQNWADYSAFVSVYRKSSGWQGALKVRVQPNGDGYKIQIDDNYLSIFKIVNGAPISVQQITATHNFTDVYYLKVCCMGNKIVFYLNGVQQYMLIDSQFRSGFIGLVASKESTR